MIDTLKTRDRNPSRGPSSAIRGRWAEAASDRHKTKPVDQPLTEAVGESFVAGMCAVFGVPGYNADIAKRDLAMVQLLDNHWPIENVATAFSVTTNDVEAATIRVAVMCDERFRPKETGPPRLKKAAYPWDEWRLKRSVIVERLVDFHCSATSFRRNAQMYAERSGVSVRLGKIEGEKDRYRLRFYSKGTAPKPHVKKTYPWSVWASRESVILERYVDFDCKRSAFRNLAGVFAKANGYTVRMNRLTGDRERYEIRFKKIEE